jgi:vancomycin permeability regulator SanA
MMTSFFFFLRRSLSFVLYAGVTLMAIIIVLLTVVTLSIRSYFGGTATLPSECAIVFGAAVYGYDLPGPAIVRRVGKAAALYHEGNVQTLILSGGTGKGSGVSESEASVMRAYAMELGVDPMDIILESASHSTWENLLFARPLTEQCKKVIGISDQFHLARIELLSWRQGWGELDTIPAEERPPAISERRSLVREVFAMLYYAFYLDTIFPGLQKRY